MRVVRVLARLGRAAREQVKVRVRQPLGVLHAVVPDAALLVEELLEVLRDELNVKRVQFLQGAGDLVTLRAQPNFRTLGKRFGGRTQQVAQAIRGLGTDELRAFSRGEPLALELEGGAAVLEAGDFDVIEEAAGELVVESDEGCTIALDPVVDEPLRLEGVARELVNRIQRLRKETQLEVSDRITLAVFGEGDVEKAAAAHGDYIAAETLATELTAGTHPTPEWQDAVHETDLDGTRALIGVRRA